MTNTTADKTIQELHKIFSSYELPEQVVMDNGPQFTSEEFAMLMRNNGVKHTKCALYRLPNGVVGQ